MYGARDAEMMIHGLRREMKSKKMVAAFLLLAVVVPGAAFRAAPRSGLRPQLKTEMMQMVQVRMPTGLGLPRAASWMSGALRAIDSYNSDLAPRRGKARESLASTWFVYFYRPMFF